MPWRAPVKQIALWQHFIITPRRSATNVCPRAPLALARINVTFAKPASCSVWTSLHALAVLIIASTAGGTPSIHPMLSVTIARMATATTISAGCAYLQGVIMAIIST